MKGQISIIESIISAAALFIAFSIIINPVDFQTKWTDAKAVSQGRDILITADRLGKLYDYSFSSNFNIELLNRIDGIKDFVVRTETIGTIKTDLYIACDCTPEQTTFLETIMSDITFNTRTLNVVVCSTTLPTINNCGSSEKYPDALVIWGYKDLTSYADLLLDLLSNSTGLIEIADIPNSRIDGGGDDDVGQKRVFGLRFAEEGNFPSRPDEVLKPANAFHLSYQSYKWFYHFPYALTGTPTASIPTEGGISACTFSSSTGTLQLSDAYQFWICGTSSVYWDTDDNNIADTIVLVKNKFSLGTSEFLLNYIDSSIKIRISFKPDYEFTDFINSGDENSNKVVIDTPGSKTRTLLAMGYWDIGEEKPITGVGLNGTENGKTIWMADFARSGIANVGDDHKNLLISSILSATNKKPEEKQRIGQVSSYVNVNNVDVLEIYKVEISLGQPF